MPKFKSTRHTLANAYRKANERVDTELSERITKVLRQSVSPTTSMTDAEIHTGCNIYAKHKYTLSDMCRVLRIMYREKKVHINMDSQEHMVVSLREVTL